MRILAATFSALALVTLAACPPDEDADIDLLLRSGDNEILLCVNGAYVTHLLTGGDEGLWEGDSSRTDAAEIHAKEGNSGNVSFDLTYSADDIAWSSPQLGGGWESVDAITDPNHDELAADCRDLETRSWFH